MEKQIYYHDTDAGGVVYYGNYLKYLEEARTEFLEKKGLDIKVLRERKFLYAVRKCNLTYKSPARYGDIITCTASLKKTTAAQLIFDQKIFNKETGKLLVEAEVSLVCLTHDFKPTTLPDYLKL
ncbi:MAG: acyl-CoA thioesterase [Candidatus Omnitrophica bacterium]|nr:acyl-CoA thioesterase [Candidatus Omnitrophota bacterium]MBU1996336.1 acyl-CoA thioesterase [Candidatus Omnitrophota bacterium]MBU4333741.1 acyl-CoA thioesterase [Candidatus Omnitrophota bacterium]